MRKLTASICVALLSAGLPFASATACSVSGDYRVPTNLELAENADLILLGKVVGDKQSDNDTRERAIIVEPVSAIKGVLPSGPIALDGMFLAEGEFKHYNVISNPYELVEAHPASYSGGCIRYSFTRDSTVLFFLERDGDQWRPSANAFSRWAEDVLTDDAPWLQLSRFYTGVANAAPEDREAMLEAERDRLVSMENNFIAQLMAADIVRQLEGPNETWNATMERSLYGEEEAAAAKAVREAVSAAIAEGSPTAHSTAPNKDEPEQKVDSMEE